MRELTLLETGYLSGLLLLSLVLPFMMSFYRPQDNATRKAGMRIVWVGQGLGALAGLGVLLSTKLAPAAATLGLISCLWCARWLRRQMRSARRA